MTSEGTGEVDGPIVTYFASVERNLAGPFPWSALAA